MESNTKLPCFDAPCFDAQFREVDSHRFFFFNFAAEFLAGSREIEHGAKLWFLWLHRQR